MVDVDLSPQVVDQVREAVDMLEVVGDHVRLRRRGRTWEGLCPFHDEKTPSFSVDPEKGLYYCFGCHQGGDVFKFVMQVEQLTFPETVERLARRFGVQLPARSPETRRKLEEGERIRSLLEEAQHWFSRQLAGPAGEPARRVLQRRGFSRETWAEYGFGFAPDDWRQLLEHLTRRHPEGTIVSSGLAVRPESGKSPYDRFRDRITFPIRSADGRLVAFGGRILGDGEPKYLNSPESQIFRKRSTLFCLDRARGVVSGSGEAVVVEGYFDCLSLHRVGITHAVATLGTALTPEQARLLRRRLGESGRVVLCYDADDAGRRAAVSGARVLLAAGVEVAVLSLPQGTDPDDIIRERGAEAMHELLKVPLPLLDFLLADLPPEPAARRRAGIKLAPLVCSAIDPATRRNLVEELARQLGLRPREVEEQGRGIARSAPVAAPSAVQKLAAGECNLVHTLGGCEGAGRQAILALADASEVSDPRVRRLLTVAGALPPETLIDGDRFRNALMKDPEIVSLLAEVNALGLPEVDEATTGVLIGVLKVRAKRRRLKEATRAVLETERRGDLDEAARIIEKQSRLASDDLPM